VNTTNYDSFLALADPTRRDILMMLSKNTHSINAIADNFNISRPAISKHIKVLQSTGFISIEEKGRERYCVLSESGFRDVQNWINYFEDYWNTRMKSLDAFLKKSKSSKQKKK
jgi:DNA-binding transcriptional ArsR family regulator